MIKINHHSRQLRPVIQFALGMTFWSLSLAGQVSAQSTMLDGQTPPGVVPGAPAGSYALSGFENVNLFNGKLNFHLPLATVGGRGEAGYTIPLTIETKWHVERNCPECTSGPMDSVFDHWWNTIEPGYSPGVLIGRYTKDPTPQLQCSPPRISPRIHEDAHATDIYHIERHGIRVDRSMCLRDRHSLSEQ
jgi:hypothetical protein